LLEAFETVVQHLPDAFVGFNLLCSELGWTHSGCWPGRLGSGQ
jgi:hypothetical protein